MKNLIKTGLLCLVVFQTLAQRNVDKEDRIQSAKIGMITNRLNLTVEQSPAFWAVYNDFEGKRREHRQGIRRLLVEASSMASSEDKILAAHREIMAIRQRELDLEKDYFGRFLKVINIRQYAELQKTERDFNQLLINKLRQQGKQDEN